MKGKRFYAVDVFAEGPFAGKQLAVFPDAADPTSEQMQTLALEWATRFAGPRCCS